MLVKLLNQNDASNFISCLQICLLEFLLWSSEDGIYEMQTNWNTAWKEGETSCRQENPAEKGEDI